MHRIPKTRATACIVAVLLAVCATGALGGATLSDRVFLKGKEEPTVRTVTADNIDGVKLGSVSFPQAGIDRIEYADAPASYRSGEMHREQGRFEEAVRLYEGAMRSTTARKFWLNQYCLYHIALCYLEMGEYTKASKAFTDLLKDPKTRFLPDAMLAQGRIQFEQKAYSAAVSKFDDLANKGWEEWKYRANLWKSRALLKDKKYPQAERVAQSIVSGAPRAKYPDIIIRARAVEALVQVEKGSHDEGAKLLKKLIDDIAPAVAKEREGGADTAMQLIESQCKNALGQCFLKKALQTKKADDYRAARLAFLWTVVLYSNFHEERAEALFYGAKTFEKLGDKVRANELKTELTELYPDAKFE